MAANEEQGAEWTGRDLYDLNGEKIGAVSDIRAGEMTAQTTWLVVKTGLLGTKKVLVPASEVRRTDDGLVASFTKDLVKNSPSVDDDEVLDRSRESEMCTYYGLDYVSEPTSPVEGCTEGQEKSQAA